MADHVPHTEGEHPLRSVYGVNTALWKWARDRAKQENRTFGELVNEIIASYRQSLRRSANVRLRMTSTYELDGDRRRMIRGVDPDLWRWLIVRSTAEGRQLGEFLSELLYQHMVTAGEPVRVAGADYRKCVNCSRLFLPRQGDSLACSNKCRVDLHQEGVEDVTDHPYKATNPVIRTIRGLNPLLWQWLGDQARLEDKTLAEVFNEVLDVYRRSAAGSDARLEMISPLEADTGETHSINGIDDGLWRWTRERSARQECRLYEFVNELVYRHMIATDKPKPAAMPRYRKCVICETLFLAKRRDSLACSGRCRVALHRARKSGSYTD